VSGRIAFCVLVLFIFVIGGRVNELYGPLKSVPVGKIIGPIGLITLVIIWFRFPGRQKALVREEKLVLGMYLLAVLSVPLAVWRGHSFELVSQAFPLTVVLALLASRVVRTEKQLRGTMAAWVLSAAAIAVMALNHGISHDAKQVTGTYDANDLALVMICSAPIAGTLLTGSRWMTRGVVLVALSSFMAVFAMAASRGGFIALVLMLLYLIFAVDSRYRFRVGGIAVALFVVMLVLAPSSFWERIVTIWKPESHYDSTAGYRTLLWKESLLVVLHHPVFGVGFGNLPTALGASMKFWKTAHNGYLQVAGELGTGGLVLHLLLTFGTLYNLRKLRRRLASEKRPLFGTVFSMELSLVAYAAATVALSQAFFSYFYLLIGLTAALQRISATGSWALVRDKGKIIRRWPVPSRLWGDAKLPALGAGETASRC
jgi:O-antigen ligase